MQSEHDEAREGAVGAALNWQDKGYAFQGHIGSQSLANWCYYAAKNCAQHWNGDIWEDIAEGEFTLEEAKQICEVHYATGA